MSITTSFAAALANTPAVGGFIVYQDGIAIFGTGETSDEAWEDAERFAENLDGLIEAPATAALIEEVRSHGGDLVWDEIGGIAYTEAEALTA